MLNEMGQVITKPWKDEIPFKDLVLWSLVFLIAAFVVFDMLRILSSWIAQTAAN